jgi:segregation and condensation protein B
MGNSEPPPTAADSSGRSLEQLSQAFCELDKASSGAGCTETPQFGRDDPYTEEITARNLLEAMLFVGRPDNQPLESQQIAAIIGNIAPQEIEALVADLNAGYDANGCPYAIASEGEGFRLVLRDKFSAVRDRYQRRIRAARLSPAAIEVLAMVAYRGPLTADEISRLRGTPSGHILRQLVQRQLLHIERPEEKPRKAVYHTTERFLAVFGLASLNDLPKSEEVAAR